MSELDRDIVDQYLSASVDGFKRLHSIEKFNDGQSNPTYLLRAESGDYVLRKKPTGTLLKSAHAVEREYRVMKALAHTDVPVPETFHLCEDESVIGSVFFIMAFVPGKIVWHPTLPDATPEQRRRAYDSMNQTLSAIHSVDVNAVGLSDFGKSGNYFARQTSRWVRQYRDTETDTIAEMDTVIDWLTHNMVEDDGRVSLVHGDFRIDNVVFDSQGVRVQAVLDWELSTLGHPYADLAYQCALWRMQPDAALAGLAGIDREALGIPTEAAYVDAYCQRCGLSGIPNWTFYQVFSLFRMAAIVQGVKKRALDGNASADKPYALRVGSLTEPLAKEAAALL
jgi:aminoglycoside phosphotransferase (APT) family kinase protein